MRAPAVCSSAIALCALLAVFDASAFGEPSLLDLDSGTLYQPPNYAGIQPGQRLRAHAGSLPTPTTTPGPLVSLSRYVNMRGCTNGLDSTCTAPLTIVTNGTEANQVQVSGLMVIGQNDSNVGDTEVAASDYAGIQSFALMPYFSNRNAGKQTLAGFYSGRRDCPEASGACDPISWGRARIGALELQTANYTERDCLRGMDNVTDCWGITSFSVGLGAGGIGQRTGVAFTAGSSVAGRDHYEVGFACLGNGRGVSDSCYNDASTTAQHALSLHGTYQGAAIDLGSAILLSDLLVIPEYGGTISGGPLRIGALAGPGWAFVSIGADGELHRLNVSTALLMGSTSLGAGSVMLGAMLARRRRTIRAELEQLRRQVDGLVERLNRHTP